MPVEVMFSAAVIASAPTACSDISNAAASATKSVRLFNGPTPTTRSLFAVLVVLQYRGPIGIAPLDRIGLIGLPQLFRARVEIQIELAVDDLPLLRIARGEIALTYRPGAIAAELGRVGPRIGLETGLT